MISHRKSVKLKNKDTIYRMKITKYTICSDEMPMKEQFHVVKDRE